MKDEMHIEKAACVSQSLECWNALLQFCFRMCTPTTAPLHTPRLQVANQGGEDGSGVVKERVVVVEACLRPCPISDRLQLDPHHRTSRLQISGPVYLLLTPGQRHARQNHPHHQQ